MTAAGDVIRVVLADDHTLFREGVASLLEHVPDIELAGQASTGDEAVRLAGQLGAMWVSPAEVEAAIAEHPAVLECAVVGQPDAEGLVKPAAYVVLRDGIAASDALADELQAFARERIAPYKHPRWVHFVADLPKTATGKVQRFRLREVREDAPI